MAGLGARFAAEGFEVPKPMIEVSGLPMVVQAGRSLPPADRWVFVCREQAVGNSEVVRALEEHFCGCEILVIDHTTEGQASTCLLAEGSIEASEALTIGACDNGLIWSLEDFEKRWANPALDALIWTFRGNATVNRNPRAYGWVEVDDQLRATRVSCKVPISDEPIGDHAIIGAFSFKRAADFFDAARSLIGKDRRINGEFYVDEAMNEVIEAGLRVEVFEVDKYIGWGTPNDLRTYQYWEHYFSTLASSRTPG
jgi:dTDP-glucose pyrophosphorylase